MQWRDSVRPPDCPQNIADAYPADAEWNCNNDYDCRLSVADCTDDDTDKRTPLCCADVDHTLCWCSIEPGAFAP